MSGSLILCLIPEDFVIEDKHYDLIPEMIEEGDYTPNELDSHKESVNEIIKILKTDGFYSGESIETAVYFIREILEKLNLVSKVFYTTGWGIDLLNTKKIENG